MKILEQKTWQHYGTFYSKVFNLIAYEKYIYISVSIASNLEVQNSNWPLRGIAVKVIGLDQEPITRWGRVTIKFP